MEKTTELNIYDIHIYESKEKSEGPEIRIITINKTTNHVEQLVIQKESIGKLIIMLQQLGRNGFGK